MILDLKEIFVYESQQNFICPDYFFFYMCKLNDQNIELFKATRVDFSFLSVLDMKVYIVYTIILY